MELAEIIQIVTSGLLGISFTSWILTKKHHKELSDKYHKLLDAGTKLKQRNDLYELYSPEHINEKVNEAAISHKRRPTKGRR